MSKDDYVQIANQLSANFLAQPALVDNAIDHHFAGCILRFAGHDFMDFRHIEGTFMSGGSDGCMNLEDDDNNGLEKCVNDFGYTEVYKNWCTKISLADFAVIAAEITTGYISPDVTEIE